MATKQSDTNFGIKTLLAMQETNSKFMERISIGIEAINHSNELHRQSLDKMNDAICDNSQAIKSSITLLRWIVIALVLALIVLAGAEKALKFLPQ